MNNSESKRNRRLADSKIMGKTKTLLSLRVGEKGVVIRIIGGQSACKRLNELGFVPGTEIKLVNKISSGPVMILVKGSKLALGRGLANKVEVIVK